MKILITGASGFIGSFIVEEALRRGMETWAAVRPNSSRQYLTDPRIHFLELDMRSVTRAKKALSGHRFDYVVHAAGITKSLHSDDFYRINMGCTRHFVNALIELQMPIKKMVYLSSLSVFGAIKEQQPYTEITDTDTPQPNTHYGRSKLSAEHELENVADQLPWVILRPTGVYGPREKDYFLMVKSIKQHVDFAVGRTPQDITFVYVKDLVNAVFLALESPVRSKAYFVSDGLTYSSTDFSQLIRQQLDYPKVLRIVCPTWLLRIITRIADRWAHLTGRITALNNDKFHILSQRNWRCDIRPIEQELGYKPQYTLSKGVTETIAWYKENHWI